MKSITFLLLIFSLVFSDIISASTYVIIFSEGHNKFDPKLPYSDLNNKYLASVKVYKDNELLIDKIRGSTLPDSIFYYQMWHKNKQVAPPTDDDILNIFKDWEDKKNGIPQKGSINKFLLSMHEIISHITHIPVIWSGKYKYDIGQHQDGESVHGQPYVPRIIGTLNRGKPYRYSKNVEDINLMQLNGSWLATINANSKHDMFNTASGINIHRGRRSKDYKDSEGCLTIHPDDWIKFIEKLPDIKSWMDDSHKGIVKIYRYKNGVAPPKPPSLINISVY